MLQYLVLLGGATNVFCTSYYIRDTLRGCTKPNRVSYLMWTIAPFIGTAAALAEGVRWAVLPVFISGLLPLLCLLASFHNPNSYWKLKPFDYLCGFLSLLALLLWGITKEPIIAIAFAITSDLFAWIPTFTKSWGHPETESGIGYIGSTISGFTGFFAIHAWVFAEYGFPIYMVIANGLLLIAIYRRRLIL